MRGGVLLPWLVGEAIFTYRCAHRPFAPRPPLPGELLGLSGLFAVLALLEGPAPQLAGLIGWGIDIAALLNLFGKPGSTTIATALSGPGATSGGTGPASSPTTPSTRSSTPGSGVATA